MVAWWLAKPPTFFILNFFMIFISFLVGVVFGSFANVLIYRIPKGILIYSPYYSFCPNCNAKIKWYDNIPILSYFLLSGKCRVCKEQVSIVYPLVELICGILGVFSYLKFGLFYCLIFFNLFFILIVISFIDFQTTEVPDVLSYYLIITGVLLSIFNSYLGEEIFIRVTNSLLGGIVGFCLFYAIEFIGSKIYKKPVLGGGDIKVFSGIGTYLGCHSLVKILFLASAVALIYVLVISLIKKERVLGKYIPFVPFISVGVFFYVIMFI